MLIQAPMSAPIWRCALAFILVCSCSSVAAPGSFALPTATAIDATMSGAVNEFPAAQQPSPTPSSRSSAGISPGRDNMTAQSDQGPRYGQPGFVGEPINLNVVNADIRDILNYITEQYGVNFVI